MASSPAIATPLTARRAAEAFTSNEEFLPGLEAYRRAFTCPHGAHHICDTLLQLIRTLRDALGHGIKV